MNTVPLFGPPRPYPRLPAHIWTCIWASSIRNGRPGVHGAEFYTIKKRCGMQSDILVRAWSILYLYCNLTLLGSLSPKWAKEEHVQLCVAVDMLIN